MISISLRPLFNILFIILVRTYTLLLHASGTRRYMLIYFTELLSFFNTLLLCHTAPLKRD